MHELSIAQNIVTIVVDEAKRAGAASVKTIRIRAGAFRGIVPEQLLFSFDFVKTEPSRKAPHSRWRRCPSGRHARRAAVNSGSRTTR